MGVIYVRDFCFVSFIFLEFEFFILNYYFLDDQIRLKYFKSVCYDINTWTSYGLNTRAGLFIIAFHQFVRLALMNLWLLRDINTPSSNLTVIRWKVTNLPMFTWEHFTALLEPKQPTMKYNQNLTRTLYLQPPQQIRTVRSMNRKERRRSVFRHCLGSDESLVCKRLHL